MAATGSPLTPLRWWEIEELLPIEQELFGDEQWSAAMFWSELAQSDSRWYRVARSELGELVAYVGICVYGMDQAWIQTLGVRPDSQRRGLGEALVSATIDHARSAGVPQLALEVRADNAAARRLYARHGFDVIGVRRGYYQPSGVDALVMAREFVAVDRQ